MVVQLNGGNGDLKHIEMTTIEIEQMGRKTEKVFKNREIAFRFLSAKGYEYDEMGNYYWKVDPMLGWLTKAKIIEQSNEDE
ncbi:hypothetical protein CVD28_02865 [Bacillus sp. M6-12]|uniref:hypothetical protein n=1 Tax=Bacillus sp. M6-12 TaxID=2054166 RepID=UPI000C75DA78|nr:hypothetical protein [Bacillus sp. M6-12]PLS19373.1 hypothetical protein CVD28_02865 [Bacillus sp. M6-12]